MAEDFDYNDELESRYDADNSHEVDESPSNDDVEIDVDERLLLESELLFSRPEVGGRDGDRAPAGRTEAGASSPFECPVCCRSFNAEFRHPMTLLCGHSTCRSVRQVKEVKNVRSPVHGTCGFMPWKNLKQSLLAAANSKFPMQEVPEKIEEAEVSPLPGADLNPSKTA